MQKPSTMDSRKLTKELTMEYIRQNNLLKCSKEDIESQIQEIVEVSKIIGNSVSKHFHDFSFF